MSDTGPPQPATQPTAPPLPATTPTAAPPLPAPLADPRPVMVVGTLVWLVATVVVTVRGLRGDGLGEAFVTCLVGLALGAVGYTIFYLQRRQVRRGGRGQQGLR